MPCDVTAAFAYDTNAQVHCVVLPMSLPNCDNVKIVLTIFQNVTQT